MAMIAVLNTWAGKPATETAPRKTAQMPPHWTPNSGLWITEQGQAFEMFKTFAETGRTAIVAGLNGGRTATRTFNQSPILTHGYVAAIPDHYGTETETWPEVAEFSRLGRDC